MLHSHSGIRYQDLLQSKALLQKDLIASEEQRLQVSKYFIDLQLKSSQDAEAAEAAKFEQGQRLLSCVATWFDIASALASHNSCEGVKTTSWNSKSSCRRAMMRLRR
jgi:hypothetical protein